MANNVVFYWIKAKDITSEATRSAISNLREFKQNARAALNAAGDAAEKSGSKTVEASNDAADALDRTGASAKDLGLVFNLMHGNVEGAVRDLAKLAEGNETAAAAVQKLNINTASLGATGLVIGYLTWLWQTCANAIEEAHKKAIEMMQNGFSEILKGWTNEVDRFSSALNRENSEIDRNLNLIKSLNAAQNSIKQSQNEAARERELNGLSVDDIAGRKAVNDKYDSKARSLASAARDKQYDEEYDALQQKLWNEEERRDKLERVISDFKRREKRLFDDTQSSSGETLEILEKQLDETRTALKNYEGQLDACMSNLDSMRTQQDILSTERDAAIAAEAAAEAKRIREAADAEEEAQKKAAEEEARLAEQQAEEERRLLEQRAREEERLRQEQLRAALQAEKELHAQKVADAKSELSASQQQQSAAQSRLAAAQAQVSQAWGWYKNKDSMQREIDAYTQQKAAEKQFEKDFERLKRKYGSTGWRDMEMGKLSVEDEATRQVALAKENEQQAAKALDEIAENTRELAEKLDELLTAKEE